MQLLSKRSRGTTSESVDPDGKQQDDPGIVGTKIHFSEGLGVKRLSKTTPNGNLFINHQINSEYYLTSVIVRKKNIHCEKLLLQNYDFV